MKQLSILTIVLFAIGLAFQSCDDDADTKPAPPDFIGTWLSDFSGFYPTTHTEYLQECNTSLTWSGSFNDSLFLAHCIAYQLDF